MRRRTVLAGVLVSLAFVLAACGADNPKPSPPASTSPSVSASASPSIVAPTMPAEAKGTGPDAAKAFVRHFITTLNYAQRTGDTSTFRRLYSDACRFCEGISDGLDRVKKDGGKITTKGWSIRRLSASKSGSTVIAYVRVAPQVVVMERGGKPERFEGQQEGRRRFGLAPLSGQWRIASLADTT